MVHRFDTITMLKFCCVAQNYCISKCLNMSDSICISKHAELQIRGSIEDNSKINLFISQQIIETVLMMGYKICHYLEIWIIIP